MSRAPYKYLDYYNFEDADLFFGREEETQRMVGEILSARLLVLFSPSGSGKTSLINAGVRPQLENMGYQTIYTRLETEPISSVCNAVAKTLEIPCDGNNQSLYEFLKTVTSRTEKPLVIFLDQFEEFFTVFREQREKRKEFIEQLAKIKYDDQLPVFVVLSLREDYFVNLHEFRDAIPSIFQNNANLRLEPFTDEEARRAIVNPLQAKDIHASIEAELVNELINDLKDSQPGIEPIKLQIVCHTLWERKPKEADQITLADYQACEGADTILSRHVQNLLNKIPKHQHGFMVRIFETLKTEDDTKRFRSFRELQKELQIKRSERLAKMLDKFSELHLLRYEEKEQTKWYEFKHDYLVGEITKWIRRRNEQNRKKRFRYAVAPEIVLALVILIWAIIEFNRFEARFTDQEYEEQRQEVYIKRRFNPFGFRVTTGILYNQIKDYDTKNAIKNGFIVSVVDKNDWSDLAEKLNQLEAGKFLYRIGEYQAGIDTLIKALIGSGSSEEVLVTLLGKADDRVIAAMVVALKYQDLDIRSRAASALVKLGKADDRVIAALVAALKDQDLDVRSRAAHALGNLGKADDHVIAALIAALKNKNWFVHHAIADALSNLGKADDAVIEALVAALKDHDSGVRSGTAVALGNLGKADDAVIEALVAALKDHDSDVRSEAASALGNLGKADDRVIAALVIALKDQVSSVRARAASCMDVFGKADDAVIEALVAALKDHVWDVRSEAAAALGNLGKADEGVIEALVAALKDQEWYVRSSTAAALGNLGKADESVIEALVAALNDQELNVRSSAASALGNIGKADDRVIDALVAALKDPSPDVHYQAAAALVNLGKADDRMIEALVAELNDQDSEVYSNAATALVELGRADDCVIEALVVALNDQYEKVRSQAVWSLSKLGKADDRVIAALVAALKDHVWDVRSEAASALGNLGKSDDRVIVALVAALNDQESYVRLDAAIALVELGQADDRVIAVLVAMLNDQTERSYAAAALGNLLKVSSQEKLFEYLKNELSSYRTVGAQALARQDSITDEILNEINRLKDKDKHPWVRLGAWQAYELIQKRLKDENAANQFIQKADSLFQINKFREAENQFQSAFDQLMEIIRIDSLKIARTKFQQARCTAKMKRLIPTLDHLEIAFQYNKAWRDTLRAELAQKGSEWEFMKENWYLNDVLLKTKIPNPK